MSYEIAVVIIVVLVMLICLVKEVARPEFIIFCSLAVILLLGIISPADALKGFSNEGMLTVALLFIVAGAVKESGMLHQIAYRTMGNGVHPRRSLFRMMLPISAVSAFLNNTPVVLMFTPIVRKWCQEHNISPSKFLIPLSYATIFGGTLTLIGTSTNLVVHGLMIEQGMSGFTMFQLAIVSLPACLIGIIYMGTIGYKQLPNRKSSEESFENSSREYLGEAVIEAESPLIGKTIEEAGLRNLDGLYLIEIISNGERVAPVTTYQKLKAHDQLIFTGLLPSIVQLQQMKGLRVETGTNIKLDDLKNGQTTLIEAVISHQSSLLFKTVKENQFRTRYNAGIVAIHRNQERINSKVGDIELKPGDTLLLLTNKEFLSQWKNSDDFYLLTPVEPEIVDHRKSKIALFTLVGMILLASFNILPMFQSSLLAVMILFLTRTVTLEGAKKYIQFSVLLIIACSIGIGIALEKTGAAALIAGSFVQVTDGFGVLGALIIIYLLTTVFTEVITNNAAAVLMFSIAHAVAIQLGVDPMAFFVAITIAASASFATPIGYQTNLIVYGPGGYRFSDYLKVGIPLNLLYFLVTVTIVYFVWII